MNDVPDSFGHYLAAWNERDVERIRSHLVLAVREDVLFIDPANTTVGIDALEAMIRNARAAMDADYQLASGIDGHHLRYRYRWEVRRDGQPPISGMDDDGRRRRADRAHRRLLRRLRASRLG